MGTSKCFLFMRILILTTMAISIAMNAAIIGALVTKRDCKFAELMRLPDIFLVLFVLLCFDFSIYLAFSLLWPARTSVDEKICSQVLLENGHDYKVGNKRNPLTDHLLGELEDTTKMVGIGHDPVLDSECETTLQEQVMVFDQQDETFDIGETPLSKTSKDHLGQSVVKETPVSEALHVDTTDSVSCHDSLFLSEHECNARNLLPYGQASTSEFHSVKNILRMINDLAVEGFPNGEVVRDAVSSALSQQVAELISIRRKEINDTVRFCNEYASSMKSKVRVVFPSHHQFADILDDFWGNLFDLHGKFTEKGNAIRLDLLIGLDVEEIKSCPCYFDVLPGGNNMCPEHGNCTLSAVVAFRKRIMDSFLTEDPSLLKDEKVSYFTMENDQVQYEVPIGMGSPLEELNKMEVLVQKCPSLQVAQQASKTNVYFSYNELKGLLLTSFRACILNISKIKKADWLIDNRGGYDEKLVGLAAEMVIFGDIHPSGVFCPNAVVDPDGKIFNLCTSTLGCGDGCMWLPTLLISFGVWCISRIFEVLLSAKQPLLFGKYSRVLNRLQGILDPAFLKPVQPVSICPCTKTVPGARSVRMADGKRISVEAVLEMLMEVEATIFSAKHAVYGGEEKDLKSVLNRYKLLLSKVASQE
ncbi:unnamed protein product [Miscanthus lutarioriparius]|uniref:Uncharacterized protein n=1 Tax=Miscanthus lutarioriparius TaxID=422564 RepID=A0A811Q479_9POAL|nr:unnamed protein product [Miscanthus lutarioriparius]